MANKQKRGSIEDRLQKALTIAGSVKAELAAAEDKIKPLRRLVAKSVKTAANLLAKYSQAAGLTVASSTRIGNGRRRGKRKAFSPETKAKMAAAQRKRWATAKKKT